MGNPPLIWKSVIFPVDSAQKYISDNYMNEFLCAGHSHLVRRRPSWLVVVLDWRYLKVRAAANSIHSFFIFVKFFWVHHGHLPNPVFTMGTSPWVRSCAVVFPYWVQYPNTPPELAISSCKFTDRDPYLKN